MEWMNMNPCSVSAPPHSHAKLPWLIMHATRKATAPCCIAWHDECPPPPPIFPAQIFTQILNAANRYPPTSIVATWSGEIENNYVSRFFLSDLNVLNVIKIHNSLNFGCVIFQQVCCLSAFLLLFGHVRFLAASFIASSPFLDIPPFPSRLQLEIQIRPIGNATAVRPDSMDRCSQTSHTWGTRCHTRHDTSESGCARMTLLPPPPVSLLGQGWWERAMLSRTFIHFS